MPDSLRVSTCSKRGRAAYGQASEKIMIFGGIVRGGDVVLLASELSNPRLEVLSYGIPNMTERATLFSL